MAECLMEARHLGIRAATPCAPPRADMMLELDSGGVVALEVRGLTDPERQESIATKARIGRVAEAALRGRHVYAHVAWESDIVIPAKDHVVIGEAIAEAIREMLASSRSTMGELDEVPASLAPYVAAIYLYPPEEEGAPRVRTSFEAWTGSGSTDAVQYALDDKEAKLDAYRRAHADVAVWLLLWTSAGESQPVTTRMLDREHLYRSGFDRAFVLDYPRRQVLELRLLSSA